MFDFGLNERTCLVIGAGDGIGRATTEMYAAAGCNVACVDVVRSLAEEVATVCATEYGVSTLAIHGDACDPAELERIVTAVRDWAGEVGVVVDIVGRVVWGALAETSDDDWDRSFSLTLRHAFYLLRRAATLLGDQPAGGALVFIASISGMLAAPRHGPYGAAKAGLISLVKTASVELAPKVRVNAVAPGTVATPRVLANMTADRLAELAGAVPLQRQAKPSDVAAAAMFLGSDLADYITGHVLVVDGGLTAKSPLPF